MTAEVWATVMRASALGMTLSLGACSIFFLPSQERAQATSMQLFPLGSEAALLRESLIRRGYEPSPSWTESVLSDHDHDDFFGIDPPADLQRGKVECYIQAFSAVIFLENRFYCFSYDEAGLLTWVDVGGHGSGL